MRPCLSSNKGPEQSIVSVANDRGGITRGESHTPGATAIIVETTLRFEFNNFLSNLIRFFTNFVQLNIGHLFDK
jgi:hypothetical protein